jgi:hypothetical protein
VLVAQAVLVQVQQYLLTGKTLPLARLPATVVGVVVVLLLIVIYLTAAVQVAVVQVMM